MKFTIAIEFEISYDGHFREFTRSEVEIPDENGWWLFLTALEKSPFVMNFTLIQGRALRKEDLPQMLRGFSKMNND